jgi:hypothetical protein
VYVSINEAAVMLGVGRRTASAWSPTGGSRAFGPGAASWCRWRRCGSTGCGVERKTTAAGVELKNPDRGEFSAVIASFGVRDHDGDVVLREAFAGEEGKGFPVSAYGHTSWSGALPVGHATLHTTATEAVVTGSFFMESTAGRDTWAVVKALHDRGITQEWSWGFECLDSENGTLDGQSVKFLKSVRIFEASPVLRASGSNTRTVAVKSAGTPRRTCSSRSSCASSARVWRTRSARRSAT